MPPKTLRYNFSQLSYPDYREEIDTLCRDILTDNPSDVDALVARARICKIEGNIEEASKLCTRALEVEPLHYHGLKTAAILFFGQKKYTEARELLLRVLPQTSRDAQLQTEIARCFLAEGDANQAETWLLRAINQETGNPDFARAHYDLSRIYAKYGFMEGNIDRARPCARKALDLAEKQENPGLLQLAGRQLAKLGYDAEFAKTPSIEMTPPGMWVS